MGFKSLIIVSFRNVFGRQVGICFLGGGRIIKQKNLSGNAVGRSGMAIVFQPFAHEIEQSIPVTIDSPFVISLKRRALAKFDPMSNFAGRDEFIEGAN